MREPACRKTAGFFCWAISRPRHELVRRALERDEIRLGRDDGPFFFSCPERNAARVLRAGAHFTLHGVVFAILCPGLDSKKSHPALARDQAAQRVAEERDRARGFFWLSGIDDLSCNTPNAERDQRFMMLQAATTLHQPLIAYQAIFAIAHPRNTAIPEIVFGVRQHSHFPVISRMHGHTIQSILDQPRIFGSCGSIWRQGDVGECKNRPGPQRDPTSSGTVDGSTRLSRSARQLLPHLTS